MAGNTATLGITYGNNCGQALTSLGYNLTDDTTGTPCGFTQLTDALNANPSLGPLADNGGPTHTVLPGAGGPAVGVIPTGTTLNSVPVCPRSDQRGVASDPGFNCTIGAVEVVPTGTLSGDIYLCSNGAPTTTEVPGETLAATGPQGVPTQANPLASTTVEAGTYSVAATAPVGYQFSVCGNTTSSPTQQVVVPQNGAGAGVFYVTPISPCAAGLTPHALSVTSNKGNFTGLFCANAKGFGTYTQGSVHGQGSITTRKGVTTVDADGPNLDLFGVMSKQHSNLSENAPKHVHDGTFTLS